jgi:hypothetical protein
MKKNIIIFLLFFFITSPVHAADFGIPENASATEFIVFLFKFGIMLGGLFAVIMLVKAGLGYMQSGGDPGKIEESKKIIQNSVFGILVLLSSYLLLNTINSSLTQVSLYKLPEQAQKPEAEETSEEAGVYLYQADGQKMFLKEPSPLVGDQFITKSIKMISGDYQYGAVLFDKGNYEGNCSWINSDLSDLSVSSGEQNTPAIKTLKSIYVFKKNDSSPSITFYNNIDCKEQSKEYGEKYSKDKKGSCTVSGSFANKDIIEACPNFVGNVVSMSISGEAGVILKGKTKEAQDAKCQLFPKPVYSSCVNVIRSSYVYDASFVDGYSPKSFTIIPMFVDKNFKSIPIIQ